MPILQNLMEEAVKHAIDDYISEHNDICSCEQCRLDAAALALNKLPPRYVVTNKGASYGRADFLELQKYIDILGATAQAIKLVKEHPRH